MFECIVQFLYRYIQFIRLSNPNLNALFCAYKMVINEAPGLISPDSNQLLLMSLAFFCNLQCACLNNVLSADKTIQWFVF